MKPTTTCVIRGCKRPATPGRRGCCATCYARLWREIRKRKLAWSDLVEAGLCLPSRRDDMTHDALKLRIAQLSEDR